jgi:hypothetical protein
MSLSNEHVYIIKNIAEPRVYKIGRSTRIAVRLTREYDPNSTIIYISQCNDCKRVERCIIDTFKRVFIHRREFGLEYFEGDVRAMRNLMGEIVNNCDDRNDRVEEQERRKNPSLRIRKHFNVDKILSHSGDITHPRKCTFVVKWEGYPHEDNTTEPYSHVKNCIAYQDYVRLWTRNLRPTTQKSLRVAS